MKENDLHKKVIIILSVVFMTTGLILLSGKISFSQENDLKLNEKDYFEMHGFNVLVFENQYNGMFFDEKTAGILLIHHGVRTAPEQWDQIPTVAERKVNKEDNSVAVVLRYADFDFNSRMEVRPPMIAHSQVGYYPGQEKVAVIELDKNDKLLKDASVLKMADNGEWIEKFSGEIKAWGTYLRYNYARFDFSSVSEPGISLNTEVIRAASSR